MNSIFSFRRRREEPPPEPAPAETAEETTAGIAPATLVTTASVPPLDTFIQDLRGIFAPEYIPPAQLEIFSLTEKPVGLGNYRGAETRGPLFVADFKGGRLDCLLAFHVLASTMEDLANQAQELIDRLAQDKDTLEGEHGRVLRLNLERSGSAEHIAALGNWHRGLYYRVLYEYHYLDEDAALGLIARIPIHVDSSYDEVTTVTDHIVRWDSDGTPPLKVRGQVRRPLQVREIYGLMQPLAGLSGQVTLTAVVDGVSTIHLFSDLTSFYNAFVPDGDAIPLGGQPYRGGRLALSSTTLPDPLILKSSEDSFCIAYQGDTFGSIAYLRVIGG